MSKEDCIKLLEEEGFKHFTLLIYSKDITDDDKYQMKQIIAKGCNLGAQKRCQCIPCDICKYATEFDIEDITDYIEVRSNIIQDFL